MLSRDPAVALSSATAESTASWAHFSHDADIGVVGKGPTKAEAFRQAALALPAVVTDPRTIEPLQPEPVFCLDLEEIRNLFEDARNVNVLDPSRRSGNRTESALAAVALGMIASLRAPRPTSPRLRRTRSGVCRGRGPNWPAALSHPSLRRMRRMLRRRGHRRRHPARWPG